MDDQARLREELIRFVKRKFCSRLGISDCAEDIVDEAFLALYQNSEPDGDKENFGYLSVACIRVAYKYFKKGWSATGLNVDCAGYMNESDFVDEISRCDDVSVVLASLETLMEIERIVVCERYFADFTFSEIARIHNININTILSHHRRALEKLRFWLSSKFDATPKRSNNRFSDKPGHFTKLT